MRGSPEVGNPVVGNQEHLVEDTPELQGQGQCTGEDDRNSFIHSKRSPVV